MTEERQIETIEFKLAHLEQAVQQLSDVVARQQRELDAARARVQRLAGRIEELAGEGGASATAHEPPPHY